MTEETPTPTVDEADQIARTRLQTLSNDLAAWGDEYGLANDPYVSTLTQAIDSRDNLTAFATSDPHDLLPHPEPRAGEPIARIARILTILRNVLVFLPVAITWLSISRATEKSGNTPTLRLKMKKRRFSSSGSQVPRTLTASRSFSRGELPMSQGVVDHRSRHPAYREGEYP